MTKTEFNKWLKDAEWYPWSLTNLDLSSEAASIVSQATSSLFIAKGCSSDSLVTPPFLSALFRKCFDLEAKNGTETVTLVFDVYRQSWATEVVQRFLNVPCFNAFASSKPLDYFCVIVDGRKGLIGYDRGYKLFDDPNIAYCVERVCLAVPLSEGLVSPVFPTTSLEESKNMLACMMTSPIYDLNKILQSEWDKAFKDDEK